MHFLSRHSRGVDHGRDLNLGDPTTAVPPLGRYNSVRLKTDGAGTGTG